MEEKEQTIYNTPNGIIKKLDTFKGKQALVGDYLPCSYFNTKMVLESLGFEVDIEETMQGAKAKALNEYYDVIFINNIYRYGGTGLDLLKELQENKEFCTPVVIHTISDNIHNQFIKLGFDGYLKKPIKQDETIKVLQKIFQ